MAVRRTQCLSTKLTADEWATVSQAAAGQTLSAWTRTAILQAAAAPRADHVLLAEVLAMRAILLHIQVAVHNGEPLTTEHLHRLVERVDQDKLRKAQERLAPVVPLRVR
jgi:hypothetical protein